MAAAVDDVVAWVLFLLLKLVENNKKKEKAKEFRQTINNA